MDKNSKVMIKIPYGLYILTARDGDIDNGCVINTVTQITANPISLMVAVNKSNYTEELIRKSGKFNVSILDTDTDFETIQHFGFQSGRDVKKIFSGIDRTENGVSYISAGACAVISVNVTSMQDMGTHTVFFGEVCETKELSDKTPITYSYYHEYIKPKPAAKKDVDGKVWVCTICGYEYDEAKEGTPFDKLPVDWVCPLCKHPKSDFELKK